MSYHPYITGANRTTSAADRLDVFGAGSEPSGLGTLGAPVNSDHVFEHLGENLPPFGNPRRIVDQGAQRWEEGFQDRYSGKIVTEERDRFSPNTRRITVTDPMPVVSRPDELSEVKNNAQILHEKTARSVRTYRIAPTGDALAEKVNADAELRNLQQEAVALVYESQMDALRAKHEAARARGQAVRENVGAMLPSFGIPGATSPRVPVGSGTVKAPIRMPAGRLPSTQLVALTRGGGGDTVGPEFRETPPPMSQTHDRFDPTKIALILGGVAVAAAAAYFFTRNR